MNESSCTNLAKCLLMFTGVCYLVSMPVSCFVSLNIVKTLSDVNEKIRSLDEFNILICNNLFILFV